MHTTWHMRDGDLRRMGRPRRGDDPAAQRRRGAAAAPRPGDCKAKLAEALASIRPADDVPDGGDDPQGLAQYIAEFYAKNGDGPAEARLGAVFRRYADLRGKLAMANMRLVAHVAKRFRDRGIALLRPDAGGLLRPARSDRPLRPRPRDEAGDLRDLVDPPGDAAGRGVGGVPRPPEPAAPPPARAEPGRPGGRKPRPTPRAR